MSFSAQGSFSVGEQKRKDITPNREYTPSPGTQLQCRDVSLKSIPSDGFPGNLHPLNEERTLLTEYDEEGRIRKVTAKARVEYRDDVEQVKGSNNRSLYSFIQNITFAVLASFVFITILVICYNIFK